MRTSPPRLRGLALPMAILLTQGCAAAAEDGPGDSTAPTVIATQVDHVGYRSWKIDAANGSWYFQFANGETGEEATGFSSAVDRAGNDWIGNDCEGRREWRGWPNFGPDGFGHPCRGGGGISYFVDEHDDPLAPGDRLEGDHLVLESRNGNYTVRYHFFASHGAIEVVAANAPYAFLFEGPVAGEMDIEKQHYVLEDGKQRRFEAGGLGYLDPEFDGNFPSPYFYFVDRDADQLLYVGAARQSAGGDEGWVQPTNMVIFSFGREADVHALSGSGAVSVFGFLDKSMGHDAISGFIRARLEDPFTPALDR